MDSKPTYKPAAMLLSLYLYLVYIFGKDKLTQKPELRLKGLSHYVPSVSAEVRGIFYTLGEKCTVGLLFVYDKNPKFRQLQLLLRSKSKHTIECEYRMWVELDGNNRLATRNDGTDALETKEAVQFAVVKQRLSRLMELIKEGGIGYEPDINFDEVKFPDVENFLVTSGLFTEENIVKATETGCQLVTEFRNELLKSYNDSVADLLIFCPFFHRN